MLTGNQKEVFTRRYVRKDAQGNPIETVEDVFHRVALNVGIVERQWHDDNEVEKTIKDFESMLSDMEFLPNSPTWTGAGTPLGLLSACFVLPVEDDMGRKRGGIFDTLKDMALIFQTGGGIGLSLSKLRPDGAYISTSGGKATGPVGFLKVFDKASEVISQGGCLTPDTLVFTDKGMLRLDEIIPNPKEGWGNHSIKVATDEGVKRSPAFYNNGISKTLKVYTNSGISIAGTPDHKVKLMTKNGLLWKEIKHLQKGDYIAIKLGEHTGHKQELDHPTITHHNQIEPTFPNTLNKDLAFFLGYLTGNGFVASNEGDYRVGVTVPHKSYLMKEMPRLITSLFSVPVYRSVDKGNSSTTLIVHNRALKEFLEMNDLDKKDSLTARIPKKIRMSPKSILGVYLQGLFEADGSLCHGYPQLNTSSHRLANEIATMLIGLGCPVNIRARQPSKNRWGDSTSYFVRPKSHIGLNSYRKYVPCHKESRFMAVEDHKPDLSREQSYRLPYPNQWIGKVLNLVTRKEYPRLRKSLLRYRRGSRNLTVSAYKSLSQDYEVFRNNAMPVDNIWFVEVTKVEPAGESLTLDLEVEDNHTYLANGIITHNPRRGAGMAVLRYDHPDILDFITCKQSENDITNFNISVAVDNDFMTAVKEDLEIALINPQDGKVWDNISARSIMNAITSNAVNNGEPGLLFLDRANEDNPCPSLGSYHATNPCGEQFLKPYQNCCLGTINLVKHLDSNNKINYEKLNRTIKLGVRFLDDVIDANKYIKSIPELEEKAKETRRIGLGITGLADVLYLNNIRYGSEEAVSFITNLMMDIRATAIETSVELAQVRGPFPAFEESIYVTDEWYKNINKKGPFEYLRSHFTKIGIRNATQLTIAPTGTRSTIAGVEGYGCEPVFALAYTRMLVEREGDVELQYTSPLFKQALIDEGIEGNELERILNDVSKTGSCQGVEGIPQHIKDVYVVSRDITPKEHVDMQAAAQSWIDSSISKTINCPEGTTKEDIEEIFNYAWQKRCKGITVYVANSREKTVLQTNNEKDEGPINNVETLYERPLELTGKTIRQPTPLGTAFVTLNYNEEDEPFEVFVNIGRAGSDVSAVAEGLGRLISLILRIPPNMDSKSRLKHVVEQLKGIGGGNPLGFGKNRIRSLPDGVAEVLGKQLGIIDYNGCGCDETLETLDLCPECGNASLITSEGCSHCKLCGFNKC